MNARFRFSANACLLSGLLLGPGESLFAQSKAGQGADPARQKTAQNVADDGATSAVPARPPRVLNLLQTGPQQNTPRGAARPPKPVAAPGSIAAPASSANSPAAAPAATAPRADATKKAQAAAPAKAPQNVQQTAGTRPQYYPSAPQSAVQRQLQELYRKDGREMPPMDISSLPTPEGAIPPAQPGTPGSGAQGPTIVPSKPSLWSRVLTGMHIRKAPRPMPPAYIPQQPAQRPPAAPVYVQAPRAPQAAAQAAPQIAAAPQRAAAPVHSSAPRAGVSVTSRPGLLPGFAATPLATPTITPGAASGAVPKTAAPKAAGPAAPLLAKSQAPDEDDMGLGAEPDDEPLGDLTAEGKAAGSGEASRSVGGETSPYTGLKLIPDESGAPKVAAASSGKAKDEEDLDVDDEEDEEQLKPADRNQLAAQTAGAPHDDREKKLNLVSAHGELSGLKGFCPVTLKNYRQLAFAKPEFKSEYQGKTYTFASADAKAEFDSNPASYAPACKGADIVCLAEKQGEIEGSLQHAAWYKGRLYLFSSMETRDKFVSAPSQFAPKPAGPTLAAPTLAPAP